MEEKQQSVELGTLEAGVDVEHAHVCVLGFETSHTSYDDTSRWERKSSHDGAGCASLSLPSMLAARNRGSGSSESGFTNDDTELY